jgi:hypothetical protein
MHGAEKALASGESKKLTKVTTDASALYRACIGGVPHKMQKWSNLQPKNR